MMVKVPCLVCIQCLTIASAAIQGEPAEADKIS